MNKRQSKSQASSSRAGNGAGLSSAFGVFGSTSKRSTLSYLTPLPTLSSIEDPSVVVFFKNLSKKDDTTKSKALEDLVRYIQGNPHEQGGTADPILETWIQFYPRLSIDNSRRVRELAHTVLYELFRSARKRMEKHTPQIVGSWLAGIGDKDKVVVNAAKNGFESILNNDNKRLAFRKRCQVQILEYAQEAINETPQSLSDERNTSADDVQEKYFRVVNSSMYLVASLFHFLGPEEISEHREKYEEFLQNKKLWTFSSCEDASLRKSTCRLLALCLTKALYMIEGDVELISRAFIAQALRSSQSSSTLQLLEALKKLAIQLPRAWDLSYKGKKTPFENLQNFIEKGSQGAPSTYWWELDSLFTLLPTGVVPNETEDLPSILELVRSFRKGIGEEPRHSIADAWSSYVETVKFLVVQFSQKNDLGYGDRNRLVLDAIFPIFEQYIHPSPENSRWSVGNNIALLIKTYRTVEGEGTRAITDEGDGLSQIFDGRWHTMACDFAQRIKISLPEQSKDYEQSQTNITSQGHRWFELLSAVLKSRGPDETHYEPEMLSASPKIVSAALKTMISRNGKPFSAAAIVEAALRLTPVVMERNFDGVVGDKILVVVKSFMKSDLPELITSPSSTYLVSILNLFRSIPGQEIVTLEAWQTSIDHLLQSADERKRWKVITELISNDAYANVAQAHPGLQNLIRSTTIRAMNGEIGAWPIFEAAVTFNTLADGTQRQVIGDILAILDINGIDVFGALRALEFISTKNPSVLRQDADAYVAVITSLLALTEIDDLLLAERASYLKAGIDNTDRTLSPKKSPMLHVIRRNLETASAQSLSIQTLVEQAKSLLETSEDIVDLFPNLDLWQYHLKPLLSQSPSPALGVLQPFAGAVFLGNAGPSPSIQLQKDLNGYSVPLRMAMYSRNLIQHCEDSLPSLVAINLHYVLHITWQLVNDQLGMHEEDKLFASARDPDIETELRNFVDASKHDLSIIALGGQKWQEESIKWAKMDFSAPLSTASALVWELFQTCATKKSTAFYAYRVLTELFENLVDAHGYQSTESEVWLQKLDVLKPTTTNIFGALSMLSGLKEHLGTSNTVNTMCNRLISDVAGASAQHESTVKLLVLLNACLSVYGKGELPVAQNRLIFAIKQILSWTDWSIANNSRLLSESCHALQRLLPSIKDVYGHYWESALGICVSLWDSIDSGNLTNEKIPAIGMSLKLYYVLRNLKDTNEDLGDALTKLSRQISHGMVKLLKLQRSQHSVPQKYVDELLAREISRISPDHVKDCLPEFYPLIASDFRDVQSAAFDILHRALPETQQILSMNVLLDHEDAQLPDELLSLLLDPPSATSQSDTFLEEFQASVRAYLLSWHLIFDSYKNAAYNVRNDYSDHLKSGKYVEPLLDFIFGTLVRNRKPGSLKSEFEPSKIRSFDMWVSNDTEPRACEFQWLLVNIYYLSLEFIPSLAKAWYLNCRSRQLKLAVETMTQTAFSPLIIEDNLEAVRLWGDEQKVKEDEQELIVKVSQKSREVFAGYEIDDTMMQIVIRLPDNYPLEGVMVDCINRVAIPQKTWNDWKMFIQGAITFNNGTVIDGLNIFRSQMVGALKGQTECAICYSIVSSDKKLPAKKCQTCSNLFHASCLYKWFSTSNQSTCPLCRNPFNYGS